MKSSCFKSCMDLIFVLVLARFKKGKWATFIAHFFKCEKRFAEGFCDQLLRCDCTPPQCIEKRTWQEERTHMYVLNVCMCMCLFWSCVAIWQTYDSRGGDRRFNTIHITMPAHSICANTLVYVYQIIYNPLYRGFFLEKPWHGRFRKLFTSYRSPYQQPRSLLFASSRSVYNLKHCRAPPLCVLFALFPSM